jgi:hypothetical protein
MSRDKKSQWREIFLFIMRYGGKQMQTKRCIIQLMTILMFITVAGCSAEEDPSENYSVTAVGTIQKSGFTTYMYGTHILRDNNGQILYALKSDNINLDGYVDIKNITVKGSLIRGYPVEGGPEYLDVKKIE